MVVDRLRQETAALHKSVESRVDLLSSALGPQRYIRILQAFHAFFVPCGVALEKNCPDAYANLRGIQQRTDRLRADLSALDAAPDADLDARCSIPAVTDAGHWLGALYVIEGSALGGQIISRHLEKHFGWKEGRGYSFFRGYAAQTGERWKQVCAALDSSEAPYNQICEGAHQSFNHLKWCLETSL